MRKVVSVWPVGETAALVDELRALDQLGKYVSVNVLRVQMLYGDFLEPELADVDVAGSL